MILKYWDILDLSDNQISDISVLEKVDFKKIESVCLFGNKILISENFELIRNIESKGISI